MAENSRFQRNNSEASPKFAALRYIYVIDEVFELSSQQPSTECGMSAFPCTGSKDRAEKLHPRKRSRREADTNADKLIKMIL
ncbi:hypothetical protein YC2023_079521 [Brassica napus]